MLLSFHEEWMFGMRDLEEERNMASSEVSMKGNSVNGKGENNVDGVGDAQNGSSSSSTGRGNNVNVVLSVIKVLCNKLWSDNVFFSFHFSRS